MALTSVPPFFFLKQMFPRINSSDNFSATTLLDAVNEGISLVCLPPKTGPIHRIYAYYNGSGSLSGTLSGGVYAVDATTGLPVIASPFGGMVAGTVTNPAPGGASVQTINLGTDCTIGSGDLATPIAVTVFISARTSGSLTTRHATLVGVSGFPYYCINVGSWAKSAGTVGMIAFEYADGSIEIVPNSVSLLASTETLSTAGVNEKGTKFTVPFGCRIAGVEVAVASSTPQAGTICLYNSSDQLMASIPVDGDIAAASFGSGVYTGMFATPQTLTAGATYRVTWLAGSASTISLSILNPQNATYAKQYYGSTFYSNVFKTSRTGAGAWSDVSTAFMGFYPILDQIDVSSAGGGLLVGAGMNGGIRG